MAAYHDKASRYTDLAPELLKLVKDDTESQDRAKELIVRLVNAGIVCVPRACQSTVRLNVVKLITEDIDVHSIRLVEKPYTRRDGTEATYKALHVVPNGNAPTETE